MEKYYLITWPHTFHCNENTRTHTPKWARQMISNEFISLLRKAANRFRISPNIVPLINHKCEREGKQWASTYVNTQMTSRHSMKLNEKKNTRKEIERQRERETVFSLLILRVMWLDFTTESDMLFFFCCIEYGLLEIYQIKQTLIHKRTYSTIYSLAARFSTDYSAQHSYKTV